MSKIPSGKIGLALGGGAVLGAAHIGVLRALDERGFKFSHVAGTSIGAFIATLYAFGYSWEEMREVATDLDWRNISGLSLSRFGLLSNHKIENVVTKHLGDVDFKDARIPLSMVATDLSHGEKVVISEGNVALGVMASTCIPGIFIPVERDDRMLVDGGVMENVPVLSVQEMGADYIVGVDLNTGRSFSRPKNIVDVLISTVNLTLRNAARIQTEDADLLITPDLSGFDLYDTGQVEDLIERGYSEGKKQLASALD
jgi:NTE family protein